MSLPFDPMSRERLANGSSRRAASVSLARAGGSSRTPSQAALQPASKWLAALARSCGCLRDAPVEGRRRTVPSGPGYRTAGDA